MSSYPPLRSSTSALAIVSLVFGILAWCVMPFIGAMVAVIFGHLARSEIRHAPTDVRMEGDGMAIAGMVLGYVQLALSVLLVGFIIVMLFFGMGLAHLWH